MRQIQATFVGYGGKPRTIFSAYDEDADVLVIGAEADYRRERRDGCIVLSNDKSIQWDDWFGPDEMQAGINAFFELKHGLAADAKSPRIVFSDRAIRANPEQSIERDGFDETGPRYRVSDGVTCAQVAVLATCIYALKVRAINDSMDMMTELQGAFNRHYYGLVTI